MSTDPFPRSEQIKDANAALIDVIRRRLPWRVYGGERWWTLYRRAALVRMTETVESLMDLMALDRNIDGQTLVRSLYEQVVTFAWIAIDPDQRQWRWVRDGQWERLKLHKDAASFGDGFPPILSAEEVTEYKELLGLTGEPAPEAECGASARRRRREPDPELLLPPVTAMAEEADRHWPVRVRGLQPAGHPLGFRGLYLPAYRVGSRAAHGSMAALDPYVVAEPNRFTISNAAPGPRLMWALVGPLFGMALLLAMPWEPRIDEDEVRALVDLATGPEVEEER